MKSTSAVKVKRNTDGSISLTLTHYALKAINDALKDIRIAMPSDDWGIKIIASILKDIRLKFYKKQLEDKLLQTFKLKIHEAIAVSRFCALIWDRYSSGYERTVLQKIHVELDKSV